MAGLAKSQIDVPLPPGRTSEELVPVWAEQGFELKQGSVPGSDILKFTAKRQPLRNALQGDAKITANGSGSTVELVVEVAQGEPFAVLDGRRNRATLRKLTDMITARLGHV